MMHIGCPAAFDAGRPRRLRSGVASFAVLALGLTLLGVGCAPFRSANLPTPDTPTATAPQPRAMPPPWRRASLQGNGASPGQVARIGAALSLTGRARMFGAAQRNGISLAQDEINASHFLGTKWMEVIVEDDGADRDQAAAVFQKFIENSHVVAIIGPTLSDTALSVDPIAQQAAVPVLAISNSARGVTQIGNFIFRDCLSESQLTPQVIKMVRSRLKVHRVALLYSDTDPNRSGSRGFKKGLQDFGVRIVAEQVFRADETDFATQIEEIVTARPDALFVTAPAHAAASILIQARQFGLQKVPIIGSSSFNSDAVLRSAGDAAEGLIVGSAWSATKPNARNQQFIQSYRARYGVDPDQLGAQAYAGVYILATALKDAGTVSDPRALRDALERVNKLETPMGMFSFNDAHDADYPPSVQIVRNGHFEPF